MAPHHCQEGRFELLGAAHFDKQRLDTQWWRYSSPFLQIGKMRAIIWIPEKGHARYARNKLLKELHPFGSHFRSENSVAGNVFARPRQAVCEPRPYRIADCDHYDGDRRRHVLRGSCWCATVGNYDVNRNIGEIGCGSGKSIGLTS